MTQEEFDRSRFGNGQKFKYKDGKVYDLASVDFEERLIGLEMNIPGSDEGEITWVRCENVEIEN